MRVLRQNLIIAFFGSLAGLYFLFAVIGGVKNYSPIPFMDMWGPYVNFFIQSSGGDVAQWWSQHNEHRIVLARIFFWIDVTCFRGSGVFLIVVNYALAATAFGVFYLCLNETLVLEKDKHHRKMLGCIVLILLFSWMQKENFSWGFQSQFFMGQLLPLIAFFLLHRVAVTKNHSNRLFFTACVAGIASLGTMANGVLALPLMVLLAIVLRMGWRRVVVLVILTVLGSFLYFHNYVAPKIHGSVVNTLLHNPLQLMGFLLTYIGNPFYYLAGLSSLIVTQVAGFFLIGSAVFFAWKTIKKPAQFSLQLALLTFLLYIGGTALGTGTGRLIFGVAQATTSRYTTPALMAWSALLVLYAPMVAKGMHRNSLRYVMPFALLIFLLMPQQLLGLDSQKAMLFERKIAALAIESGIRDQLQISVIYPEVEWPIMRAKEAFAKKMSVFGDPVYRDAINLIGTKQSNTPLLPCQGSVDETHEIQGESRYVRIQGWIFQPDQKKVPQPVHILDQDGLVVGYALTGQPRPDVKASIDPKAKLSGFKGYLFAEKSGAPIILKGLHPDCEIRTIAPQSYFQAQEVKFGMDLSVAKSDSIVGIHDWQGTDSQKTRTTDYRVFGSFVHGDQDTGSVTINLKRGDSIFYRSGPVGGKQFMIDPKNGLRQALPVATDWVVLSFSNPRLSESFTITLTDSGSAWGEWSAIALRN